MICRDNAPSEERWTDFNSNLPYTVNVHSSQELCLGSSNFARDNVWIKYEN